MQTTGSLRINQLQLCIKTGPTLFRSALFQIITDALVGLGQLGQPLQQHFKVHHAATHQQRYAPGSTDLSHFPTRIGKKFCSAVNFRGIANIQKAMRRLSQNLCIWLGTAYIEITIDLG